MTPTTHQAIDMQFMLLELAIRIADRAVRSDIEIYAAGDMIAGTPHYDTTQTDDGGDSEQRDHNQAIVDDALAYIALRGNVFPWRLVGHKADPLVVRFEAKEPAE